MTYFYDHYAEENYGLGAKRLYSEGTFITPDGKLFDVDTYTSVAHAGGFVIPFFMDYINPDKKIIRYYTKDEVLHNLQECQKFLSNEKYGVPYKAQQMRLHLVKYLINVYKSQYSIWDDINETVDLSYVTGIKNGTENLYGRDRYLKDILVQACNYDSIESMLDKGITTSKFNIYETFYDYILNDYKIYQIPKKVYDEKLEKYVDYSQPEWMISDKELRLKDELTSICKIVPLEDRKKYLKSRQKISRFDMIN